jgi:hypothetical protein
MSDPEKDKPVKNQKDATTNPDEATDLQAGVGQIIVDFELEQGRTVKLPQPRRKRVVFKY